MPRNTGANRRSPCRPASCWPAAPHRFPGRMAPSRI